jgi:TonB-dependent SusC/RagA subfamily outer membrane receptor
MKILHRIVTLAALAIPLFPLQSAAQATPATTPAAAGRTVLGRETPPEALLVIDDVVIGTGLSMSEEDLEALNISSLEILRGPTAVKLYGESASKGAVLIRTYVPRADDTPQGQPGGRNGLGGGGGDGRGRAGGGAAGRNQPLMVVDGVVLGRTGALKANVLKNFDVKSIEVVKAKDAASVYGDRGANGVIMINTKAGRKK